MNEDHFQDDDLSLSEAQKLELTLRLADHWNNPDKTVPWVKVRERLWARIKNRNDVS